jgi:hypothetical protein
MSADLPRKNTVDETTSTEEVPLTPPVSGRWIALGSIAMLLGLLMGFIMSSLGK